MGKGEWGRVQGKRERVRGENKGRQQGERAKDIVNDE